MLHFPSFHGVQSVPDFVFHVVAQGLFAAGAVDEAVGIPGAIAQILPAVFENAEAVFAFDAEARLPLRENADGLRVGVDGIGRSIGRHMEGSAAGVAKVILRLDGIAAVYAKRHDLSLLISAEAPPTVLP